jgi:CrcB protein
MNIYLIMTVGLGGFLGSITRYILSVSIQSRVEHGFPFGTLTVNLLGCFLIGLLIGLSLTKPVSISDNLKLFLSTGFLGGFTTFSAFSAETFTLLEKGDLGLAFLYAALSIFIGLFATWLGILIMR